jgi:hypothetical protein
MLPTHGPMILMVAFEVPIEEDERDWMECAPLLSLGMSNGTGGVVSAVVGSDCRGIVGTEVSSSDVRVCE